MKKYLKCRISKAQQRVKKFDTFILLIRNEWFRTKTELVIPLVCKLSTKRHWCCIISVLDGVTSVITQCEVAAVFARLVAPLLLSHCINSRESPHEALKRLTPLILLQDPDTAQMWDEKRKKKIKHPNQLKFTAKHFFFFFTYFMFVYKHTWLNMYATQMYFNFLWSEFSIETEFSLNYYFFFFNKRCIIEDIQHLLYFRIQITWQNI